MIKLAPLRRSVEGKRVVMIDDSIVRGTTMRQIVALLRRAGAAEVHVRISAPEFLWPCYYGTDIDERSQLASVQHSPQELYRILGADSLGFLPWTRSRPSRRTAGCTSARPASPASIPTPSPRSRTRRPLSEKRPAFELRKRGDFLQGLQGIDGLDHPLDALFVDVRRQRTVRADHVARVLIEGGDELADKGLHLRLEPV